MGICFGVDELPVVQLLEDVIEAGDDFNRKINQLKVQFLGISLNVRALDVEASRRGLATFLDIQIPYFDQVYLFCDKLVVPLKGNLEIQVEVLDLGHDFAEANGGPVDDALLVGVEVLVLGGRVGRRSSGKGSGELRGQRGERSDPGCC